MGKLNVEIILRNGVPPIKKVDRTGSSADEHKAEQKPAAPREQGTAQRDDRLVEVREIDIRQTTYQVCRAVYDFYGLHLDLFLDLDEKTVQQFNYREDMLCQDRARRIEKEGKKEDPHAQMLKVHWNTQASIEVPFVQDEPPSKSHIVLKGFSLEDPDHIASLEYLIGLVNGQSFAKSIPGSAYTTASEEIAQILKELQDAVGSAMLKAFNTSPLHTGLSFLQNSLSPSIMVRIAQMTSISGAVQPVLVYQSPLLRLAEDKIQEFSERTFKVLPLIAPATFRLTPDLILLVEMVQPVPTGNDENLIAVSLADFYSMVEGAERFFTEAFAGAEPLTNADVDYLFRVPSLASLDMKERTVQWEYLRGSEVVRKMKVNRPDEEILAFIDQVKVREAKDMLLYDSLQEYAGKEMLDRAFELIGKMGSPVYRVLGFRTMGDIALEKHDINALKQILSHMASFLDSVETFQENLASRIRDLLVVVSEQTGLDVLLELYPVKASAQIRLAWLSGAFRSSPRLLLKNEKEWLSCLSRLTTEMEESPQQFVPLLEELLDMTHALKLMPKWEKQADELIHTARAVSDASRYRDYYLSRLELLERKNRT